MNEALPQDPHIELYMMRNPLTGWPLIFHWSEICSAKPRLWTAVVVEVTHFCRGDMTTLPCTRFLNLDWIRGSRGKLGVKAPPSQD